MKFVTIATHTESLLIREEHKHLPVIVTGVGAINVIKALSHLSKDTEIINYGYVGSINLPIGKTYEIGQVGLFHPNVTYKEHQLKLEGDTKCYTSCDFILQPEYKYCVYDMELAFIAAMGFKKVTSYKTVSDHLDYNQYERTACRCETA